MKIVIINGSPRENGLTASILHRLERYLSDQGADVEFYDLSALNISQCRGCCACYMTGSCMMNDDAEMLTHAIEKADGLILGSPTYASNVSGYMKLLIDRGHFVIEQLLTEKHCLTVTTGENYGSSDASKVLKKLVIYSGGSLVRSIVVNSPFNSGVSSKTEKHINIFAQRLIRAIKGHRSYPFQCLFHRIIFSLGIKPFVKKKGETYRGVVTKWKEYGV